LSAVDVFRVFPDAQSVARHAAGILADLSRIPGQKVCNVALSGGSTPQKLFELLAAKPLCDEVDWSRLRFFWGDERCVPAESPDSNFGWAQRLLFEPNNISPEQIYAINGENDPANEAEHYGAILSGQLPLSPEGFPAFDLVFLGMGDDGHTASLFPGDKAALESHSVCVAVRHPQSGQDRVSITLPVINAARMVVFMVTGAAKKAAVSDIRESWPQTGSLPASRVRPHPGRLRWLLDLAAASPRVSAD